ncbi:hypothetical protein OBBRIDRAFT_534398 [Obba rivulosa]|uniref:Uncharacterized protein n=1 Tax=Obba rivulosa TaxID=1052685 RepID=A0A8E2DTG3_9APHY|nr:hypothetical protein OBBRIDRAFT_534398 [Obba rivulosa]
MAHLPPKPDFEVPPPSRYPPDYRSYARPPPPLSPPPDRVYRERSAYPPRSPPRSRVSGDSYVASRPVDTHRSSRPSMDSYVASYDRRDDDRYRDAPYREREPPPREREWERRERDYAPPEYRHRPREPSRERVDWAREREADRLRRWEEYERHHDRRTHERRDYNPPRARDADWRREDDRRYARDRPPPEPERMWIPRASKSPPRRMGMSHLTIPNFLLSFV